MPKDKLKPTKAQKVAKNAKAYHKAKRAKAVAKKRAAKAEKKAVLPEVEIAETVAQAAPEATVPEGTTE